MAMAELEPSVASSFMLLLDTLWANMEKSHQIHVEFNTTFGLPPPPPLATRPPRQLPPSSPTTPLCHATPAHCGVPALDVRPPLPLPQTAVNKPLSPTTTTTPSICVNATIPSSAAASPLVASLLQSPADHNPAKTATATLQNPSPAKLPLLSPGCQPKKHTHRHFQTALKTSTPRRSSATSSSTTSSQTTTKRTTSSTSSKPNILPKSAAKRAPTPAKNHCYQHSQPAPKTTSSHTKNDNRNTCFLSLYEGYELHCLCSEMFHPGPEWKPPKFVFIQLGHEPPWKPSYKNLSLEDKACFQAGSIDTSLTRSPRRCAMHAFC